MSLLYTHRYFRTITRRRLVLVTRLTRALSDLCVQGWPIRDRRPDLLVRLSGSNWSAFPSPTDPQSVSANAPVTIIEFSDISVRLGQDPRVHVQQLLPKYQGKSESYLNIFSIRPMTGVYAPPLLSDCVFRLKQQSWLGYRSSVFFTGGLAKPGKCGDTLVGLAPS